MALGRIRTDLALEAKEKFEEEHAEVRGVVVKEDYNEEKDIRTTTVIIETENGAKTMGRPQGVYITLEAPNMSVPDEDYHREISKELAEHMAPDDYETIFNEPPKVEIRFRLLELLTPKKD